MIGDLNSQEETLSLHLGALLSEVVFILEKRIYGSRGLMSVVMQKDRPTDRSGR